MKKTLFCIIALLIATTGSIAQSAKTTISSHALQKLDPQLILALKEQRKEAPFDKPTSIRPYIPIRDGNLVLIDFDAIVSEALKNHIISVGGQLMPSPSPDHIIRAMLPLTQLEALAQRADIKSIKQGQLSVTREIKPAQRANNNHQR